MIDQEQFKHPLQTYFEHQGFECRAVHPPQFGGRSLACLGVVVSSLEELTRTLLVAPYTKPLPLADQEKYDLKKGATVLMFARARSGQEQLLCFPTVWYTQPH